jgi:hypothetical protein
MPFYSPPEPRQQKFGLNVTVALVDKISRNGGEPRVALQIRIGELVAKMKGWNPKERFDVQWGYGDDFGTIRLRRVAGKGVGLQSKSKKSRSMWIDWASMPHDDLADESGKVWRFRREKHGAVSCEYFNMDAGALGIRLPATWWEPVAQSKWSQAA